MKKEVDVYKQLQIHIENLPINLPSSRSGVEIKILKHFFTPEEVKIALCLGALPESINRIYRRVKKAGIQMEKEELEAKLDQMVKKGSILGGAILESNTPKKRYSNALLVIGMYEHQVNRITEDFFQDMENYLEEAFHKELHNPKIPSQMRTIPVNESTQAEFNIGTYDDIKQIIKSTEGPFAIQNCICKQGQDLLGKRCKTTDLRETCLTLGRAARHSVDLGLAKFITKDEALNLMASFQQEGLILQPANTQQPEFVCACCGCCCQFLKGVNYFDKPAEVITSNYYASVNSELCSGCRECEDFCQMGAISFPDEIAQVNLDRCIGCGLCASACQLSAIKLKKKAKETIPPKNRASLYQQILINKKGYWGTFKTVGKMMLR